MICLKSGSNKLVVGRFNVPLPTGHSVQCKLQAVVGSIEKASGLPQIRGFFNQTEITHEIRRFTALKNRRTVAVFRSSRNSFERQHKSV